MNSREIFLLAGEASGDERGAELIRALKQRDPSLLFSGMGGPQMRAEGMEILADVSDLAVVGIIEVLKHYSVFSQTMQRLLVEVARRKPAAVIGVDYPGFNLRFLRKAHRLSSNPSPLISHLSPRLIQYISPQLWAWHESRKWKMAEYLDLVLCIFPFEPSLYAETGLKAVYVGHPLASQSSLSPNCGEVLSPQSSVNRTEQLLAFFPGSREKEIRSHMPVMRQLEAKLMAARPQLHVAYAASTEKAEWMIRSGAPICEIKPPSALLAEAKAGVVCSGTATLESALAGLPICVVYRVAWPTYWMGQALIRVPFLAMPNLLVERQIVKEFIQGDFSVEQVLPEVERLLDDPSARQEITKGYAEVRVKLGHHHAAENAAREILDLIRR